MSTENTPMNATDVEMGQKSEWQKGHDYGRDAYAPEARTRVFTVSTPDPEISSIEVMLAALRDLDVNTQRRVLNYLTDRAESDAKKATR